MWNPGWDDLFQNEEWGRYPPEELVRFVARNFFAAPQRSAVRFLEIGCGPGANLMFLAREGFTVDGLDGSSVALGRAASRLAEEGLSAELQKGDATARQLFFGDQTCTFDHDLCLSGARTRGYKRRAAMANNPALLRGRREFFCAHFSTAFMAWEI